MLSGRDSPQPPIVDNVNDDNALEDERFPLGTMAAVFDRIHNLSTLQSLRLGASARLVDYAFVVRQVNDFGHTLVAGDQSLPAGLDNVIAMLRQAVVRSRGVTPASGPSDVASAAPAATVPAQGSANVTFAALSATEEYSGLAGTVNSALLDILSIDAATITPEELVAQIVQGRPNNAVTLAPSSDEDRDPRTIGEWLTECHNVFCLGLLAEGVMLGSVPRGFAQDEFDNFVDTFPDWPVYLVLRAEEDARRDVVE